jgi:hypothetical protein
MTRKNILAEIDNAQNAHNDQVKKIDNLFDGFKVEEPTALDKKKCDFGLWLYGEDNRIKEFIGDDMYENLIRCHDTWHIDYNEIYEAFYNKPEQNFVEKVLHIQKGMDPVTLHMSNFYHREIIVASCKLICHLDECKKIILSLDESKFD